MMIKRLLVPVGLAVAVGVVPVNAGAVAAKTPAPPKAGHWLAKKTGPAGLAGSGSFTLGASHAVKKLTLKGGSADCSDVTIKMLSTPKVALLKGAGKGSASEWAVGTVQDSVLEGAAVKVKGAGQRFNASLMMAFPHPTGAGSKGRLVFTTPNGGKCFINFKMKKG
jgi:hypothetical protein